jgi:hypothetical protein
MPTEGDELALLLRELEGEAWTRRLRRSDPRHGDLVRRLSPSAPSLAEAIDELRQLPVDAPQRAHYAEVLRMARELAAGAPATTVEDELSRILAEAGLNGRQRQIIARRLGWDGNGGMTLEAAASGEMTRERVRQLEERVRQASAAKFLPVVEAALDLLAARAPITNDDAADLLAAEGLARGPFDPVGLINAARFAGIDEPVSLAAGCIFAGDQQEDATRVAAAARKLVSRNGAASVSAIVDLVDDPALDADVIRRVLVLDPETRWLDGEREWLFLPTGKNRAANHLRKMLAVAPSLSVSDVREGFRRYRDREVILPRHVVPELCECFDWVRVDGGRIAATVPLDYRAVLENTEETLVDIFHEHGPVLDRAAAVDLGERYGLDRTTTGLYLGWSPIIERIATNRYTLRGADVPAGTLEAMRGSSQRRRVQRGYGWTSGGRLWVCYTLSQAVIDSNVVGVPSALKDELRGGDDVARYDLAAPNHELGQLATDGSNIWGLARLLKRYAAEVGDALVLEFDLAKRNVHAFVGGQELLDPENRPEQVVEESAPESDAPAAADRDGRNDAADGADAFDRAAASAGASGLQELAPLRSAMFDPQLDLQSVVLDVEPAQAAVTPVQREDPAALPQAGEGGVRGTVPDATAHATTLIEALTPGRKRAPESSEQDIVGGLERLGPSEDDRRHQAPADEHPAAGARQAPEDSEAPGSEAADKDVMQQCVVPGCESPGKHRLGVRCRVWQEPSPIAGKSKTSALWAPDSDAFLCDQHALGGAHITLIFEPNDSGETAIKVIAAPYADDRRTPIRHQPRGSSRAETSDATLEPPELGADEPPQRPR